MVCKSLLLPLMAGLALCATKVNARSGALRQQNLASRSLSFIENKGQIVNQNQEPRRDIDFKLSAGNGLNIFIGGGAIHYQWAMVRRAHHDMTRQAQVGNSSEVTLRGPQGDMSSQIQGDILRQAQDDRPVNMYRMDVKLLGANPNAQLITAKKQHFYERYYTSQFGTGGVMANSYQSITYKDIYPHIDWVWYVKGNTVEYDFVIHPGGKVSDIKLKYSGNTTLAVHENGSLLATTPMGSITERAPYSFQQNGQLVASQFVLQDDILSFRVDDYTGTLIIDPTLEWGTYFGGLGEDISYGLASASGNDIYMTGITSSISNIVTSGSYQTTFGGNTDAFITKFNASGDCLWASYFGGIAEDRASAICMSPTNNSIYLSGVTKSAAGVASAGAFQELQGGDYDAFLAKFDTSGQRIWATYYGGSGSEGGGLIAGVACDDNENVFLSGETTSDNDISTTGSYQASRGGGTDAFIAKFDSTGQRLWGTYLGGSGSEFGRKMGCDSLGNVYLGGYTNSISGIATSNAYQGSFGGVFDAFLGKFDPSGNMEWATYFGGSSTDIFNAIDLRPDGTSYIGGITGSNTGIATAGVHQDTLGGVVDGFLAAFSNNGQLQWATYLGGTSLDVINAISVNEDAVFASGTTTSGTGISTPGSFQDTLNSGDAFVVSFDNSGQRNWGTYFGGVGAELMNASAVTNSAQLYLAGQTNSASNVASAGSYQTIFGGGSQDAFLIKFNVCEMPQAPGNIIGDTVLCDGQEYVFSIDSVSGAISYSWIVPDGWAGNSDSTSISIIPGANSGSISVAANNSCATSDSVSLNVTVHASPEPEIENNNNTLSTTQPYSSYQWNKDGQAISGATAATYTATVDGSYSVTVTNDNGCSGSSDTVALDGVGIDELQTIRDAIRIYPNPAEDVVFIESPVVVNVEVMDIEGRVLKTVAHTKTIQLGDLAEGMYLLRIYDGVGRLVKVEKIIKQLK